MLFLQAMLNKNVIPGVPTSAPYNKVVPTPHEENVRSTLGFLNTAYTNSDAYKTTILMLLRCARSIAHKCDYRITTTIRNITNDLLKKDTSYIEAGTILTQGRIEWLQAPGFASLPVVRNVLLKRYGAVDSNFEIRVVNVSTGKYNSYIGVRSAGSVSITTTNGVVKLQGEHTLADQTTHSEVQISPCYSYPYSELVSVLKTTTDVQVVIRTADVDGANTQDNIEFLGLVAVGLATRGVYNNIK